MNNRITLYCALSTLTLISSATSQGFLERHDGEAALERSGTHVEWIQDVTGDQIPEYLVCAPDSDVNGQESGKAQVIDGRTGAVLREHIGAAVDDRFGTSATWVGDLDSDGIPDYAISAPGEGSDGAVTIFRGVDGSVMDVIFGPSPAQQFGSDLDGGTDLNDDGWPDIIVADVGDRRTTVVSGFDRSVLLDYSDGSNSVAAIGDVDGDGFGDFVIGNRTFFNGDIEVFSGQTMTLYYRYSPSIYEGFGEDVAAVPDLDGDGVQEIVVGAPDSDFAGLNAGTVVLISGRTGVELAAFHGDVQDQLGHSVGGGDVNGDGFGDLIVGVPLSDLGGRVNSGSVIVRSGIDGSLLSVTEGLSNGDKFGTVVSRRVADLNLDGLADVLASAPESDIASPNAGSTWVVAASPSINLSPLTPAELGKSNSIEVAGAVPNAQVYLVRGSSYRAGPIPGCGALASIQSPEIVSVMSADQFGSVTYSGFLPLSLAGTTLLIQAIEPANCSVSGVREYRF